MPTPDKWLNIDYAKDAANHADQDPGSASLLAPTRHIGPERFNKSDDPKVKPDLDMTNLIARPLVDYDDLIQKGQTDSPFIPTGVAEIDADKSCGVLHHTRSHWCNTC